MHTTGRKRSSSPARRARRISPSIIRSSVAELADTAVPLGVGVRHLLERLQALHDHDPGLTRAIEAQVGQMPRIPEAFRERVRTYIDDLERILRGRPDVRPGNRALMAHLVFEIAETVTAWLAHGGSSGFDRDDAIVEATAVICRYLERPTRSV